MLILMSIQKNWAYLGKDRKLSHSTLQYLTSASNGTSLRIQSQSQKGKQRNTRQPFASGYRNRHTRSRKYKHYTANFYMQASSYQWDALTSQTWKPCWGLMPQILSCHTTP